jgi:hypothetical protein
MLNDCKLESLQRDTQNTLPGDAQCVYTLFFKRKWPYGVFSNCHFSLLPEQGLYYDTVYMPRTPCVKNWLRGKPHFVFENYSPVRFFLSCR